ncbi:hypothetical protein WG66_001840 [Moniliophthora roreri]|nr:hypothetical protein WG66_001840 [Moniliophthora roreri]
MAISEAPAIFHPLCLHDIQWQLEGYKYDKIISTTLMNLKRLERLDEDSLAWTRDKETIDEFVSFFPMTPITGLYRHFKNGYFDACGNDNDGTI